MGTLINSTYVALDGVVENPHLWPSTGSGDPTGEQVQTDLLRASDALVMGRRTYEGFAPVWPTRSGDPYSAKINAMPKYVASTTLTEPDWANTQVIADDVVGAIGRLKNDGLNLVQYGIGSLTSALMAAGLVDELRLWMYPLFAGGSAQDSLLGHCPAGVWQLTDVTRLNNDIVILGYRADRS